SGERQQRKHHDDLLRWLFFGGGPDLHAALKELRVFDHEPYPDCGRTGEKDGDKNPRFPIIKRPRGEKEQRSHDDRKQKKLYCAFEVEAFVHNFNLASQLMPSVYKPSSITSNRISSPMFSATVSGVSIGVRLGLFGSGWASGFGRIECFIRVECLNVRAPEVVFRSSLSRPAV